MQRKPLLALAVLLTAGVAAGSGSAAPSASAGTSVLDTGLLPACSNGKDDDGDGLVDMNDPGCSGPLDTSEYNPPPPQCSNGKDDDGDGLVDLKDLGCSGLQDDDERNSAPPPPPPPGGGKGHLPHEFFGIAEGGAIDARDYARMEQVNVHSLRVSLLWRRVEPSRGRFVWPDRYVAWLASYGIRPTFMVFGTPEWATGSSYVSVPPLRSRARRAWRQFLRKAVQRYGPHGSFWTENPGLPKLPVRSWQIWNEPNLAKSFARANKQPARLVKDPPRTYARLVKTSDKAISHVDKHAKVVLAGLTSNPKQDSLLPWRFLRSFLKVRGIERHFNAAALHPYASNVAKFKALIKRTRRAMGKGGARRKGLWLTEVGWGSATDWFSLTKGMQGQARILRKSFKFVVRNRKRLNISHLFWFYWRDPPPQGGHLPCTFCTTAGLLAYPRTPKPAYRKFERFTLRQR
jgi:hypothetical protein